MATEKTIFARLVNVNASNDTINVQPDPADALTFTADTDGDGTADGDLKIDSDGPDGTDANTLVSVNGGEPQSFTYLTGGDFPPGGSTPANLIGQDVIVIELEDGSRYTFFQDPDLQTEAAANSVPPGAATLEGGGGGGGVVCFTAGALIATPGGPRAIETLAVGDLVETMDHGPQPIRWIGRRRVAATGAMAPWRIPRGLLGPHEALLVSPQHRLLVTGPAARRIAGCDEVLAKAKHLPGATREEGGEVEYLHVFFDRHEIIFANGAAAESLRPGRQALRMLDRAARAELLALFPQLALGPPPDCRPTLKGREAARLAAA